MADGLSGTCLYFGTFNPIHTGHLMIAQAALSQFGPVLGFGSVTFVPAGNPPHRHHENDLLDARRRLHMVQLATASHPCFKVSTLELERPGRSYTVDSLRLLIAQGVVTEPVPFIIGSDALQGLPSWREPEALIRVAHFLQAPRPECELVESVHLGPAASTDQEAKGLTPLNTSAIAMPMLSLSSSWIRQQLQSGPAAVEALRFFLPEPVRLYIRNNGLYQQR